MPEESPADPIRK